MEREIIFRGKRKDAPAMWAVGFTYEHEPPLTCFASGLEEPSKWYIAKTGFADWNMPRQIELVEVDPKTIGQFTGLPDENSVYIFEGDIVKCSYVFENACYYTVKFMEGYYDGGVYPFHGWCLANRDGEYEKALVKWTIEEYGLEVIGNIYDNPKLLDECT